MRILCSAILLLLALVTVADGVKSQLAVGYYDKTCPLAELIIKGAVAGEVVKDPQTAAGLLRMHFHDCFVLGCDGSVLIDSTPSNTAEKDGAANANSLRPAAFNAVDVVKSLLELACPGVVSCADILAYAARDSVVLTGGPSWGVEGGRRDGSISLAANLNNNLLPPTFDVVNLTAGFKKKGLSQDEMITLSGAHTIGQAHCIAFASRINNASNPDLTLDPVLASQLLQQCPQSAPSTTEVNMDTTSIRFDTNYYSGLLQNRGLFHSDEVLVNTASTRPTVIAYANNPAIFFDKFAKAMVHMGQIGVLTGTDGQIRTNCRVVN